MDFYKYINSPDIAAHCREVKAKFNLLEKAAIMYLSDADIIETLTVLRKLLRDEEDMTVPAAMHHGSIPSLKKWLRWSVEYIEQEEEFDHTKVDKDWHPAFLEDYYLEIPTPFKKGDIVCERYKPSDEEEYYSVDNPKYPEKIFVLNEGFDEYEKWRRDRGWLSFDSNGKYKIPGDDLGDMAGHPAFYVLDGGQLEYDHIFAPYTNLVYFAGELKGSDRTLEYISHFLRDEIPLRELVALQNIHLLEHLRDSLDHYGYIESSVEAWLNSVSKEQQKEGV
jgi:hypothetical protein